MRANPIFLLSICTSSMVHGQDQARYDELIAKAYSLYEQEDYKASGGTYAEAFKTLGWNGTSNDRYNAACAWALAGVPDSAFFQLKRIAELMDYANLKHITTDPDLNGLHTDKRWNEVIDRVAKNKERLEANYDKALVAQLDSIFAEDQGLRNGIAAVEAEFGHDSKEMKAYWHRIWVADSLNQIKVVRILDERGWLGPDVVGPTGNLALFLVIQHADLETQEKYLPLMREAMKAGRAKGNHLAMLEDRTRMRRGRPQVYGTQLGRDPDTNSYYLSPLEDPEHVDQRRAEVGLRPLNDYLVSMGLKWDLEAYYKDLPRLQELLKRNAEH